MDKSYYRAEIKRLRSRLSDFERELESEQVCKKIMELESYKNSKNILSFMNFGSELTIEILNKWIVEEGKNLYLPRVEKDGTLSVVEYGSGFTVGQFGIREPIGRKYSGKLDLIIVPGLAFDKDGNRIGYGKGYYDRLFLSYPTTIKVAPIFEFQLFDKIPYEEHDIKLDFIVTKNEILKIKKY